MQTRRMNGWTVWDSGGAMRIDGGGASWIAARLVREHEGLSLAPYFCPAGKLTIGYGHVILPHEKDLKGGIGLDDAEALLTRDLAWALFATRDVGRVLHECEAGALASLVFNIGPDAWRKSTLRRLVVVGDMDGAAAQFARWNKAGGRVLPGLVRRREAERRVFQGWLNGLD